MILDVENIESKICLEEVLNGYKEKIESLIRNYIPHLGEKAPLKEACEYALLNGGKRYRPALVFMIAKALKNGIDVSCGALAVEFFHTASLISDDLPSMDNEELRRGKPTLHKVYGEATAILTTYALISAGYETLSKSGQVTEDHLGSRGLGEHITLQALQAATKNTGILGATGGQFLDLQKKEHSLESLKEIIQKKTVSIFEVAFLFGWLFGGGDTSLLNSVKKAAHHFGMAFQVADDLQDLEQDTHNGSSVNFASVLGVEKAKKFFHQEVELFFKTLKVLSINSEELLALGNHLKVQVL